MTHSHCSSWLEASGSWQAESPEDCSLSSLPRGSLIFVKEIDLEEAINRFRTYRQESPVVASVLFVRIKVEPTLKGREIRPHFLKTGAAKKCEYILKLLRQ